MNFKLKNTITAFTAIVFCVSINAQNKAVNIESSYIADPPVTAASHASTLVEHKPNEILAAWFGGKFEGAKDVGIYISEYKEKKWSQPKELIKPLIKNGDTLPCWNPVLFKSKS